MFQTKIKISIIKACFAVSMVLCFYYLSTTHFEFMLSLFHYMKFNLSSISYTLIRLVQIIFSIILSVPAILFDRVKGIKFCLYLIGALYITGSSWIIYYIAQNPVSMLSDLAATKQFLQMNALNFGYLIWDSFDGFSVLFSLVEAALYFAMGYYIDKRKRKPVIIYCISLLLNIAFPFLYVYIISGVGEFSTMWLQKNTVLFTAQLFIAVGLIIAASSRRLWEEIIWE